MPEEEYESKLLRAADLAKLGLANNTKFDVRTGWKKADAFDPLVFVSIAAGGVTFKDEHRTVTIQVANLAEIPPEQMTVKHACPKLAALAHLEKTSLYSPDPRIRML